MLKKRQKFHSQLRTFLKKVPKFRGELRNLLHQNRFDFNLASRKNIGKVTKKLRIHMRAIDVISAYPEYRNNWLCEAQRNEYC